MVREGGERHQRHLCGRGSRGNMRRTVARAREPHVQRRLLRRSASEPVLAMKLGIQGLTLALLQERGALDRRFSATAA